MIDWSAIPRPDFLQGDRRTTYRDPAGHYHDGVFRVFHSRVIREMRRTAMTGAWPSPRAAISLTGPSRE